MLSLYRLPRTPNRRVRPSPGRRSRFEGRSSVDNEPIRLRQSIGARPPRWAGRINADPPQVVVGLAQVGEFSFVLASLGAAHGLLPSTAYAGLLAGVVITIRSSSVLARV